MNTTTFNEIHPFVSEKKWGYKKADKVLIEPLYQGAMPYNDGICWVKTVGWGAVDIDNNLIIPFIYKHIKRLAENRYIVCSLDNKYGVVDNHGNVIIEIEYDYIKNSQGEILELQKNDRIDWANFNGLSYSDYIPEQIIDIWEENDVTEITTENNKYYKLGNGRFFSVNSDLSYSSNNEKTLVLAKYDYDGIFRVTLFVYSSNGELIYNNIFEPNWYIQVANDSLILLNEGHNQDSYLSIIDIYTNTEHRVCNIKSYLYLDQKYICIISETDGLFGVADTNGEIIIPCKYAGLGLSFSNNKIYGNYFDGQNLAASKDGELCGIIDMSQRVIVPFKYKEILSSGISDSKSCLVLYDNLWGVIDLKNNTIIECKYQELNEFVNNRSVAKFDNHYGVINEKGEIVIPFTYDKIDCLQNGYFLAKSNGYYNVYYVFDQFGNITINSGYEFILSKFDEDLLRSCSDDKCCYVDKYGEEAIPYIIENKSDYFRFNRLDIDLISKERCHYLNLEKLNESFDIFHLVDLLPSSIENAINKGTCDSGFGKKCLVVEYQRYYIYSESSDNYGHPSSYKSCLINQYGRILYISLESELHFESSDDNKIFVKENHPYFRKSKLEINKNTLDLQLYFEKIDDSPLFRVTKGHKEGVADSNKKIIIPIEYELITITGDFVYAMNSSCLILFHTKKGIIEQITLGKTKSSNNYVFNYVTPNHIRFCDEMEPEKGIDMILDKDGNILIYQIDELEEYEDLFIIYSNEELKHEFFEMDDYKYSDTFDDIPRNNKCALYDKNLQQIYPGEFYERIVYGGCDVFIGYNGNNYVVFDKYGKKVFSTDLYSSIHKFNEGLAVVYRQGSYGVIDLTGKEIVPCVHSIISDFDNGIAITEKHGEKIKIYKDGTIQKVLWGKVCDDVFCHIVDDKLCFVKENGNIIDDYLVQKKNDLLLVSYDNGVYTIYDENLCDFVEGKIFFIDKSGLIISRKEANEYLRISTNCILLGSKKLTIQEKSKQSLIRVSIGRDRRYSDPWFFISTDGVEREYISSFDDNTHFIVQKDIFAFVNNNLEAIMIGSQPMNILSTGGDSYKVLSLIDYEEKRDNETNKYFHRRDSKTMIMTWNSETKETKTYITSGYYHGFIMELSPDKKYLIFSDSEDSRRKEDFHLIVMNEDCDVTIDETFEFAGIEKIYIDKILLALFSTEIYETWDDYSDETDYHESIKNNGYLLVTLSGERIDQGQDGRYFFIDRYVKQESTNGQCSTCLRQGIYDLKNDKTIVPADYDKCYIQKCSEENYIIVENDDEYGLYFGSEMILDCKYRAIERLSIHAEKNEYSSELTLQTDYFYFRDSNGNYGLIFNGKIIRMPEPCDILGIDTIYFDELKYVANFAIMSYMDRIDLFHEDKLIGTYDCGRLCLFRKDEDNCFFKLIEGEREGLIGLNGCYIPLDYHKIKLSKSWDNDWLICVMGDKVYQKDGKTVFVGKENESLIEVCPIELCYAFEDKDEHHYVFYDENKDIMKYQVEESSDNGTIARIEKLNDYVFSFSKKRFICLINYEDDVEDDIQYDNDYNDNHDIFDSPYYNDDLDLDQQSQDFWDSIY